PQLVGGQHLQCFRELAQHSFGCCSCDVPLERLSLCRGQQSGQLHQPRRRVLLQHRSQTDSTLRARPAAKRVEDGQIRFALAIGLDTLSQPNPHIFLRTHVVNELVDGGALANPRFSAQQDETPLPLPCLRCPFVQPSQLFFTPDEV